jgi:RNA polymerase sigma factor (sigma-70 family)
MTYNSFLMIHKVLIPLGGEESARLHAVELFLLCAADREDAAAWSEFLRRYTCKIKYFIRGTLWTTFGASLNPDKSAVPGEIQESDFLQNTLVRLVEHDCAAMKRFSGTTEDELLAYLAVIAHSVVIDTLRRHKVFRRLACSAEAQRLGTPTVRPNPGAMANNSKLEREILGRELSRLIQRNIRSFSGTTFSRDQLVFELYFSQGLSYKQIALCKGINLSKAGVEKLLNRLVDRIRTLTSAGKPEARCDEKR